ncbi:MAG TPA: hypothetical protein VK601_23075, partial [Kofleriaceae bacterium]|nr:hypothetical protein [Kofleriaceae bacterium]
MPLEEDGLGASAIAHTVVGVRPGGQVQVAARGIDEHRVTSDVVLPSDGGERHDQIVRVKAFGRHR